MRLFCIDGTVQKLGMLFEHKRSYLKKKTIILQDIQQRPILKSSNDLIILLVVSQSLMFNIPKKKIRQINYKTNRMTALSSVIDANFVNQLFSHPVFIRNLQNSFISGRKAKDFTSTISANAVIQDLSLQIAKEMSQIAQSIHKSMKEEVRAIRLQVQKIKEVHLSQSTKADSFGKQISQQINFEDEQLFDLPSIKRTINSLQQRMKEISLNSSAILDTSQMLRESRIKQDFIQERIQSEVSKIEESFSQQHETLEEIVNKKIEKQQKTINNILETLNQLYPSPKLNKNDKNQTLLTSSKSAVKLKSFFGFG